MASHDVVAFLVLGRKLGHTFKWPSIRALCREHKLDLHDVMEAVSAALPKAPPSEPGRVGRPPGALGHCSRCGRLGHTRATCLRRSLAEAARDVNGGDSPPSTPVAASRVASAGEKRPSARHPWRNGASA